MLIEVGWKKSSRSLRSPCASPQLSLARELARDPLARSSVRSQSDASVTVTKRRVEPSSKLWPGMCKHVGNTVEVKADQSQQVAQMHEGDCAMIKQVEIPQIQHSATRISSWRTRDVAQQLQHSVRQIGCTSLNMVARQSCAKRARPGEEQVARKTRCTGLWDCTRRAP